ncbi:unnamed protein product, partial [Ectocarpus sp. 8 AP-2014]
MSTTSGTTSTSTSSASTSTKREASRTRIRRGGRIQRGEAKQATAHTRSKGDCGPFGR